VNPEPSSSTLPAGAERRAARRVSLVTQIRTLAGGETLVGYSRNISTGGIFIQAEKVVEKGSELQLRFKLQPEGEILEARAVVTYAMAGQGMGMKFVDLPEPVRARIEEFVNQQET
jgi:uncharacterized protein (TIGR02266 family)